jgi:hypothetical protein
VAPGATKLLGSAPGLSEFTGASQNFALPILAGWAP